MIRVPTIDQWPANRFLKSLEGAQRTNFRNFLTTMEQVLLACDAREQEREKTSEEPEKPRTWCVVLAADEFGFGRSFFCGFPHTDFPNEWARMRRSAQLVAEKAMRLGVMHRSEGHMAASQSADDGSARYGGALWLPAMSTFLDGRQVALSGLPGGLLDEAALLLGLTAAGKFGGDYVRDVVELTNNHEYDPLKSAIGL